MTYDIAIIGAGPGGYVAAIRAAGLGAKVALIERDQVGGVCLNRGCIPTKAMIASARALSEAKRAAFFGVVLPSGDVHVDMQKVQSRKDEIVVGLRGGIEKLLKGNGIDFIPGNASFTGPAKISIDGNPIDAKNFIVATGSSWIDLPNIKTDGRLIVTSGEALSWTELPKQIAVVGGGVVGCEFACMMQTFGAQVTIIEATESILPPVEKAISRSLTRSMKEAGIEIIIGATVASATADENGVKYSLSSGVEKNADRMIVAVGRRALTRGLNLDAAGVPLDARGFIKVDSRFKTASNNIYAIGDVIGFPMLAHAASAEGIAAVENILSSCDTRHASCVYDPNTCPSPIFTTPEIASVGRTTEELKQSGIQFKTGRFPYAANGKALCDGDTDGQAIVHADESGKILGVHIIGSQATTIIAEAALAIKNRLTVKELTATIHSHPTLTEILLEAAEDVNGEAIHKASSRR